MQSHDHEISLLPGLSTNWKSGSVSGLRARGGYEIDVTWSDGKMTSATIRSARSQICKVRYGQSTATVAVNADKPTRLTADLKAQN